jgi:hypothetical protein
VKGEPFRFEDGTIGLPVYHEHLGKFAELLRLDDTGHVLHKQRLTWGRSTLQPEIVPRSRLEAVCLLRRAGNAPLRVLAQQTEDGGATWSPPRALELANPGSPIAGMRLDDGDLLMRARGADDGRARVRRRRELSDDHPRRGRRLSPALHVAPAADQARALQRGVAGEPAMTPASVVPFIVSGQIAVGIALVLLRMRRRRPAVRVATWLVLTAITLIPYDGIPLAGYVRALMGDPSLAMILFAACALVAEVGARDLFDQRNVDAMVICVAVAGVLLYPLALGLGMTDPYALGYGSRLLWGGLLVVALGAWALDLPLVAWWLTLAVAAYLLGVYESPNLWDHVIDGLATVIAIGGVVGLVIGRLRPRKRPAPESAA